MRIPLLLVSSLLIAACGESATTVGYQPPAGDTTITVEPRPPATTIAVEEIAVEEIAAFVLGAPPDGYSAILAVDRNDEQWVSYNDRGCGYDIYDNGVDVQVSTEFILWSGRPAGIEPHALADGTEVEILEMWDDGRAYGYGASWELGDGRWVTVTLLEDFTPDDLRAALDGAVPVDAAEWARLTRALDPASHVGDSDPAADDVVVDLGAVGDDQLRVTFHRPADYPLGDDDCRRACYTLAIENVGPAPIECDTYAARVRVGDHRFVAAQVAPIVETIRIEPGPGANVADPTPIELATVSVPGMPVRFYAAEVPADWCHHIVTTPDADFGRGLGEGGVVPSDPDRVNCDFDVERVPYEEPEVCFESEQDWVASTTSLREVECLDVAAAAATTTTAAAENGD